MSSSDDESEELITAIDEHSRPAIVSFCSTNKNNLLVQTIQLFAMRTFGLRASLAYLSVAVLIVPRLAVHTISAPLRARFSRRLHRASFLLLFRALHRNRAAHPSFLSQKLQSGVVSIFVRQARNLHVNTDAVGSASPMYVKVTNRSLSHRTANVRVGRDGCVRFMQSFDLPVVVNRDRRHPFNWLSVELFRYPNDDVTSPRGHTSMGVVSFHMHDIIHESPTRGGR
jgi:hypothetical protein